MKKVVFLNLMLLVSASIFASDEGDAGWNSLSERSMSTRGGASAQANGAQDAEADRFDPLKTGFWTPGSTMSRAEADRLGIPLTGRLVMVARQSNESTLQRKKSDLEMQIEQEMAARAASEKKIVELKRKYEELEKAS